MARFFKTGNNGTTAVISKEDAVLFGQITKAGGDPLKAGIRVFTFCPEFRNDDVFIVSGTTEDLKVLLKNEEHEIIQLHSEHCGWTGYVPFSNHREYASHDPEVQKKELRYRTTLQDLIDVFGPKAVSAMIMARAS
jgi:hypothetical protein